MILKSSMFGVAGVFFREPTSMHFIREIGRKIGLSQTAVRNNVKILEKNGLIKVKEAKPFDGFVANRESDEFLFYKRAYNLYSLYKIREKIIGELHPKAIVLFGSYMRGEDVEESDIDLLIISETKKDFNFKEYEKELGRSISLTFVRSINELDKPLKKNVLNGNVIYGVVQ